jgi:hypothetical protein
MGDARSELIELVGSELSRQAPAEATALAEAIRGRHGDAVSAILFYGSCLRRGTREGVFDFYVIVDDYGDFYARRAMAWLNDRLPPNVFYLETGAGPDDLRCKYAVISRDDFERATSLRSVRSVIWARFCQPSMIVYARDEAVRDDLKQSCSEALRTAVLRTLPVLPDDRGIQQVEAEDFWMRLFEETYASELRTEQPETIRSLYRAAPSRYDVALRMTLSLLDAQGVLDARAGEPSVRITHRPGWLRRSRRARRLRRPVARALAIAQLFKSAFTFGNWLPYALWKLERHTGTRLELTERQRRHPLVFGWPLFARILRTRDLR